MNTLHRALFAGASLFALLAGSRTARAAGVTVTAPAVVTGTNDFITITGPITGDVENDGVVNAVGGVGNGPVTTGVIATALGITHADYGILATSGASVAGKVVNDGTVTLTGIGHGVNTILAGVANGGGVIASGIENNGKIVVSGTGSGLAFGVAATGNALKTTIANNGTITVVQHGSGTEHAVGIAVLGHSGLAADITNSGKIFASAVASGLFASAEADGIRAVNNGVTTGAAVIDITNAAGGQIAAHASAGGLFATAGAQGINARADAVGASAIADVVNSGTINATAVASGHLAFAGARGINARADAVGASAIADVVNSGTIDATAVASGLFAGVGATGIRAVADGLTAAVSVANSGKIHASARATGASANANATGVLQIAVGGSAAANLVNTGDITAVAVAHASRIAEASGSGVIQDATAPSAVVANLLNSGTINLAQKATASGGTVTALAFGRGVFQLALGAGAATAALTNSGVIDAVNTAVAHGGAVGFATARGIGVIQHAVASSAAVANLLNSGTIGIANKASASGTVAEAFAIGAGVSQAARTAGVATAALTNSGAIDVANTAIAHGGTFGIAEAVGRGVIQHAAASSAAVANLLNSGTISVGPKATASGTGFAEAIAIGQGVFQAASAGGVATAALTNSGAIDVANTAVAHGGAIGIAEAIGNGVSQNAAASSAAVANLLNSGTISLAQKATASGTGLAEAIAVGTGIIQAARAGGVATAALTNSGVIRVADTAVAHGSSRAIAVATGAGVSQNAAASSAAVASLLNSGTIGLAQKATASGVKATAFAFGRGVFQHVSAFGTAAANLANAGTIDVAGFASANGQSAVARAGRLSIPLAGVIQSASAAGVASVALTNSGVIDVAATGVAHGSSLAFAEGRAIGVRQHAAASSAALASLINSGTIAVANKATASGTGFARAVALGNGVIQSVIAAGPAVAALTNSGVIGVADTAVAHGGTRGIAVASGAGIQQVGTFALARSGLESVVNAGKISVANKASANGIAAFASAAGSGVFQLATASLAAAPHVAQAAVSNSGAISVSDVAKAAGGTFGAATALAIGTGIRQTAAAHATSAIAIADAENSGTIAVHNLAKAAGAASGVALAQAFATGIRQFVAANGLTANSAAEIVHNSGEIDVSAKAVASGGATNLALASAAGVRMNSFNTLLNVDFTNSGSSIHVLAKASAPHGTATAHAVGVSIGGGAPALAPVVAGQIVNNGAIDVTAIAKGAVAIAQATGILVKANEFAGKIVNSGNIHVLASGTNAHATAIKVTNNGGPGATGTGTIVNNGDLFAGVSNDGGLTIEHGNAINISNAPNPIDLILVDPSIFGNVILGSGDMLDVVGPLNIDGVINPSGNMVGALTVKSSAVLTLVNDSVLGPAKFFLDKFKQTSNATLVYEIRPNSAPEIHAHMATLAGPAVARLFPVLYQNSHVYKSVVQATTLNGDFASVKEESPSIFLKLSEVRNSSSIDFVVKRTPFNAIAGLTPNELAVASGLENVYSTVLKGAFADLNINLLQQTDPAAYRGALDQLADEEIGALGHLDLEAPSLIADEVTNHLQVLGSNTGGDGDEAALAPTKGVHPAQLGGLLDNDKGSLWLSGYGNWRNADGNRSGPGYDANQWGVLGGVDFLVSDAMRLGAFVGFSKGWADFDNGNKGRFEGFGLGIYGRYDNPLLYVQAVGSFHNMTNDTQRNIDIPGHNGAPAIVGTANGHWQSALWGVNGEVGYKWLSSKTLDVSPYVGISYLNSDGDPFTEKGTATAALLKVASNDATSTALHLGARLTAIEEFAGMTVKPYGHIAWQHEFQENIWDVHSQFAAAPPGSNFVVKGRDFDRDFADVGAGLSLALNDRTSFAIDYQGQYSGDQRDSAVFGRLTWEFGAAPPPAPPPPPPPPSAAAPPPPPVKTYIVFFDFNKSNLTAEAQSVVSEAVKTAKEQGFVKVLVTGHTDTVGSHSYNQALSERRAEAVKDEMVRQGMDGAGISTAGKSFDDPLVSTGPGVREPQNRRAVIDLGAGSGT